MIHVLVCEFKINKYVQVYATLDAWKMVVLLFFNEYLASSISLT